MDSKIISEGIRLFEKNNDSDLEVFREYINNENNGDVQLNVIRLLDHWQEIAKNNSYPDLDFIKQLQFWIIFRYCVKDNFKLMRGVINHWIDNAKELKLLKNAVNSQSSLTDFLIEKEI